MVGSEWMWEWKGEGPNPALEGREPAEVEYNEEEDDEEYDETIEYSEEELELENLTPEELEELRLMDLEDAVEHENDTLVDSAPPPAPAPEFVVPPSVEEHLQPSATPAPLPPYDPTPVAEEPLRSTETSVEIPRSSVEVEEPSPAPPMPASTVGRTAARIEILTNEEGNRISPEYVEFAAQQPKVFEEPSLVEEESEPSPLPSAVADEPVPLASTTQDALNIPNVHSTSTVDEPTATAAPSPSPSPSPIEPEVELESTLATESAESAEQVVDSEIVQRDLVEEDVLEGVGEVDSGTMLVDQVLESEEGEGSVELPAEVLEEAGIAVDYSDDDVMVEEPESTAAVTNEEPVDAEDDTLSAPLSSTAVPSPTPSTVPEAAEEDRVIFAADEVLDEEEYELDDEEYLDGDEFEDEDEEQVVPRDEL